MNRNKFLDETEVSHAPAGEIPPAAEVRLTTTQSHPIGGTGIAANRFVQPSAKIEAAKPMRFTYRITTDGRARRVTVCARPSGRCAGEWYAFLSDQQIVPAQDMPVRCYGNSARQAASFLVSGMIDVLRRDDEFALAELVEQRKEELVA